MEISVREASINDAEQIFHLSNDETVRLNSINRKQILWEDHIKWLHKKLNDKNYKILLFFLDNNFVAQVKFEITLTTALISISIHQDYRGKGKSATILKKAIEYFLGKNPHIQKIIAEIRPENKTSIKSFTKVGFIYFGEKIIDQEVFFEFIFQK